MGELIAIDVEAMEKDAEAIVRRHVGYSMLGGAIPVPLLDLAAVTAVQLDMLKQLAKAYRVPFDSASARAFVTSVTSALAGNLLARLGASLIKFVPGIGWAAGGVAQVVVTGASTYAVGQLFKRLFRGRHSLEDLSPEVVKDEVSRYFEQGKDVAESLWKSRRASGPAPDALEALDHLARLRASEAFDPEQFLNRRLKVLEHVEGVLRGEPRLADAQAEQLLARAAELVEQGVLLTQDVERLRGAWRARS
jgi:uncharacterized protein (DUF697 family)